MISGGGDGLGGGGNGGGIMRGGGDGGGGGAGKGGYSTKTFRGGERRWTRSKGRRHVPRRRG